MALDTRGLASGVAQGFGLMDNYYRGQKQDDRAERGLQMREESFGMQKEQYQQSQKEKQATLVYGKMMQQVPLGDEDMQFLKDNPNYLQALNPEMDQSIEIAQRVIDPEDEMDLNSEEGLYAMNTMFSHRINRGEGGKKRIAGGYPGRREGTLALDLEVEREDGTKYNAPRTRNAGVEGDDEVLQTDIGDVVNQVQGYRAIRNVINQTGSSEYAAKMYSLLTGKEPERAKGINMNGFLVDPETGEQMGDFRTPDQRSGRGGAGGSGNAPADVQTAEWMVASNIAPDRSTAWNMLTEANANPAKYVSDFVNQELKAQESAGIYPGDENFKTTAQMRDNAIESLKVIRSRSRGTGQPEPELELDPSLPRDGSAVQQEDGSYSGVINRDPQQLPANVAPAPTEAINYLRQNPGMAAEFRAKYNYLPEGF